MYWSRRNLRRNYYHHFEFSTQVEILFFAILSTFTCFKYLEVALDSVPCNRDSRIDVCVTITPLNSPTILLFVLVDGRGTSVMENVHFAARLYTHISGVNVTSGFSFLERFQNT